MRNRGLALFLTDLGGVLSISHQIIHYMSPIFTRIPKKLPQSPLYVPELLRSLMIVGLLSLLVSGYIPILGQNGPIYLESY
jgi:hypothetical protein